MRRLSLFAVLAVTACFNPDDSEGSGGTENPSGTESSSGTTTATTAPTTASGTSAPGTTDTPGTTDDPSTGDPSETGTPTTDSGSDACGTDEICVEGAPDGWDGPGLRIAAGSGGPPDCGMTYSIDGPRGFTDAAAPPAECECSCGFPANVECPTASVVYYAGTVCDDAEGGSTIADGECGTFYIGQGVNSATATGNPPDDLACDPSVDETVPPLGPMGATSLCMPESLGDACGERSSCLPAAELNTYCVSREGDVPCPADSAYDHRTVIYGDFDDTRACGACECGEPDVTCTGIIRPYANDGCSGGSFSFPIDGSCEEDIGDNFTNARYTAGSASGSCAPSGGMPQGGVTPQQPTTLCCSTF